jgi:uncharacterized protein
VKKALAIFAKQPVPGAVKTRLCPPLSPAAAAELYRCMLLDTIAKASSIPDIAPHLFYAGAADAGCFRHLSGGMPCLPQEGTDLGERMASCFRTLSAAGFDAVAIVGSDSPDLPAGFIGAAFDRLAAGADAVFGPSADGGYYLAVMGRLYPELFSGIAWSSEQVMAQTLARAREAGIGVELLPEWYDVDTVADLERPGLVAGENGAVRTGRYLRERGGGRDGFADRPRAAPAG